MAGVISENWPSEYLTIKEQGNMSGEVDEIGSDG